MAEGQPQRRIQPRSFRSCLPAACARICSRTQIAADSGERPYNAGKREQVCTPIGTSTGTTCSSAAVGAPKLVTANIFSGEVRALVAPKVAVGPRIEYDATGHNVGISLPIYVRTTTNQFFTGGVEAGWTRDAHFQGAIVFQKAFSFFD